MFETWMKRGGSIRGLVLLALSVVWSTAALAHGPTVRITAKGLEPSLLNLFVGSTVHFSNTIDTPQGAFVCIDDACRVKSPALKAPGDGWHHTFEALGRHAIRLEGQPQATMTIMIVPRKPGMP